MFGFKLPFFCFQAAGRCYEPLPEQLLIFGIIRDGEVIGFRIVLPLDRAEVIVVLGII